jgi:hypothetical protein
MSAQPAEQQPGTDLARTGGTSQALTLRASMDYALALAESNMLPTQYRNRPANVLWATEYGRTIGVTPMAAITGVHVIEGKPSASAGLISGLVRRAGHKLRIRGNAHSATCVIIRSDDPDHPFEVTWELNKNERGNPNAEDAGLLGKDVWRKYPSSMLKSRAISQCARDACEEVLFGLHYTPEELGAEVDEEGEVVVEAPAPVATVTPLPTQDAPTAAQIANIALRSNNPASIRASFKDADRHGLLDEDISDTTSGYAAASLGVAVAPERLTLRVWLTFCGVTAKESGKSADDLLVEIEAADEDEADVIGDDEVLPPSGLMPQGEQAQAELGL